MSINILVLLLALSTKAASDSDFDQGFDFLISHQSPSRCEDKKYLIVKPCCSGFASILRRSVFSFTGAMASNRIMIFEGDFGWYTKAPECGGQGTRCFLQPLSSCHDWALAHLPANRVNTALDASIWLSEEQFLFENSGDNHKCLMKEGNWDSIVPLPLLDIVRRRGVAWLDGLYTQYLFRLNSQFQQFVDQTAIDLGLVSNLASSSSLSPSPSSSTSASPPSLLPYAAIHIRHGDKSRDLSYKPPLSTFLSALNQHFSPASHASDKLNVFLATDDGDVLEEALSSSTSPLPSFLNIVSQPYQISAVPPRVKTNENSGDNLSKEQFQQMNIVARFVMNPHIIYQGLKEIVIDLYYLSRARWFVGTGSSAIGRVRAALASVLMDETAVNVRVDPEQARMFGGFDHIIHTARWTEYVIPSS